MQAIQTETLSRRALAFYEKWNGRTNANWTGHKIKLGQCAVAPFKSVRPFSPSFPPRNAVFPFVSVRRTTNGHVGLKISAECLENQLPLFVPFSTERFVLSLNCFLIICEKRRARRGVKLIATNAIVVAGLSKCDFCCTSSSRSPAWQAAGGPVCAKSAGKLKSALLIAIRATDVNGNDSGHLR